MSENYLLENLFKLGYSQVWLEKGVLTEAALNEQLKRYYAGEDENEEHYRYNTLIAFIDHKHVFSDEDLDNFLHVIESENDPLIAGSATAKIIEKEDLSEAQFEKVTRSLSSFGNWTEKAIVRQSLIRKLKNTALTDNLFEESVIKGDKVVHGLLLKIIGTHKARLQQLAEKGANSKIRNLATRLLKSKNPW